MLNSNIIHAQASDTNKSNTVCDDDNHHRENLLRNRLKAYFDKRYEDALRGDAPGGAVIVCRGDSVLFEYYAGLADMNTRKAIDRNTTFCIASVSKQFTVVGLMRLAEKGLVDMDAPMTQYVDYTAPFWARVTPRHLASQSSGIADTRDRSDRIKTIYANDSSSAAYFPTVKDTQFEPGTAYDYVNPTFILLARIIEQTTGKNFVDYQREHLFDTAGMTSTYYFNPEITPEYQSHAYAPNDKGSWDEYDYGEETFFATRPDGGIYSTARDIALWEKALVDNSIISAETLNEVYTPRVNVSSSTLSDYQRRPNTYYAMGWFVDNTPGRPLKVYHTGDNGGYQAYLAKYPETGIRVIVLENRHDRDRWSMAMFIEQLLLDTGILL